MNYSKFSGLVACKMAMLQAFIKERRKRGRRASVCLLFLRKYCIFTLSCALCVKRNCYETW
jgi:hypothetical protein